MKSLVAKGNVSGIFSSDWISHKLKADQEEYVASNAINLCPLFIKHRDLPDLTK